MHVREDQQYLVVYFIDYIGDIGRVLFMVMVLTY